jgi:threonylcarbamoyladenosine tRNA methylthiotransferase MtaB
MKVSILTLGCRVNQSESDIIEANLKRAGWYITDLSGHPDYCIINTCTVTAKSDYQSRQLIRRAVRTGAKAIVTGCYSQLRPEEIVNIKGVVGIVDNKDKSKIINILSNTHNDSSTQRGIKMSLRVPTCRAEAILRDEIPRYARNDTLVSNNNDRIGTFISYNRSRPYLKVQDGCNFSCSYCAVPMARGRSRSIAVHEALKRAEEIESADYNEIVITGIHLGSYGYDLTPKTKLSELLKNLLKNTKIPRIRISSIVINNVDYELIELIQDKRICKHLHLPLQSGDDSILRRMKRTYSLRHYMSTLDTIMKKLPDIAIGTDIIVGFPGEGNHEFSNTKELLKFIPISYMHIFPFSPRPNTLASQMVNQNTSSVKKNRLNELKALNAMKKTAYMTSNIGKTLDIIIEEKGGDNTSIGTSGNYLKVKIPSNKYTKGALVRVRITGIEKNILIGESL